MLPQKACRRRRIGGHRREPVTCWILGGERMACGLRLRICNIFGRRLGAEVEAVASSRNTAGHTAHMGNHVFRTIRSGIIGMAAWVWQYFTYQFEVLFSDFRTEHTVAVRHCNWRHMYLSCFLG